MVVLDLKTDFGVITHLYKRSILAFLNHAFYRLIIKYKIRQHLLWYQGTLHQPTTSRLLATSPTSLHHFHFLKQLVALLLHGVF